MTDIKKLCMSCHKQPAIKKVGVRVLCKKCVDMRNAAIKKVKS